MVLFTVIKHGKEGLYKYKFECDTCGCQFLCDYSDILHENLHIRYNEFKDIWHTKCPECRKNITTEELVKIEQLY